MTERSVLEKAIAEHQALVVENTLLRGDIETARLEVQRLRDAVRAAIEISDRTLPDFGGFRTAECQAVYDQCTAALQGAK